MTKKIKLDKANAKELFVAMCKIRNSIRINSVRDEKRKLLPVNSLCIMIEGYTPKLLTTSALNRQEDIH